MNKEEIKLIGPEIKAKAGETVTLHAQFDKPCWSCIHERREKSGYSRINDQQGSNEHIYNTVVHEDTTHFIFSIGDNGRPDLAMTNNIGQLWCPVTIESSSEVKPKDKGKLLYKVGLISDIHFDVEDSKNSEYKTDLQNALEYFRKENVECICSCGDFAQYNDKDYEVFREYYNAHAWAPSGGKLPLFTPMGNHDYLRIYHQRTSTPTGYASTEMLWQNNVSVFHEPESTIHFFEYGAKWNSPKKTGKRTIKSKLNYWFEKNDCIFVFMSIDYGNSTGTPWDDVCRGFNKLDYNDEYVKQMTSYVSNTGYNRSKETKFDYQFYNPEVLMWLKDIIENNKDKRIFVFSHHFLPHKAGDSDGIYSHLRVWPYTESSSIKNKFYAGSNTLCGLTFWFIDKLNNEYKNVVWFSGHSHRLWNDNTSICNHNYTIKTPAGNETTPLVDDLNSLNNTPYDYRLYTRQSNQPLYECGFCVGLPSLSKPADNNGSSMYQASQGGILEIYENGTTIKEINFKDNNSATYVNKVIKDVDLDI